MELPVGLEAKLEEWTSPGTVAFALLGSYARGDAGPFSDVDVVRFLATDDAPGHDADSLTALVDGQLVVCSTATPAKVEDWFSQPGQALNVVAGLRVGLPLWDPQGVFGRVQQRARAFAWTDALQAKADEMAGAELVGWIEEAHKGLEGLRRNDSGRLLNAHFGLSWGLVWVMRLHRGVLCDSDNSFFDDVRRAVGLNSEWSRLLALAFGVTPTGDPGGSPLRRQVRAGLALYCETAQQLAHALPPDGRALVEATVQRIRQGLDGQPIA